MRHKQSILPTTMKQSVFRNFLLCFSILSVFLTYAQSQLPKEIGRAITMDGRRIILYDNGTFRYEISEQKQSHGTAVSSDTVQSLFPSAVREAVQSSPYNKKEYSSTRTKFSVWYNPKKWKLVLNNQNPLEEASWHMADTYCNLITDRVEFDYETWIQRIKLSYKELDPQAKLVKEEWRTVNGNPLYHMVWAINFNRMKVTLYGYYLIGKGEIAQLVVQTPTSVAMDTQEEIYRLLSGLKTSED